MPKLLNATPQWLFRPSQGFNVFHPGPLRKQSLNSAQYNIAEYQGPHRLIAKRGTEVFVVVNNQIRWTDLCLLKDDFELQREHGWRRSRRSRSYTPDTGNASYEDPDERKPRGYRVLNVGSIPQIRQLITSPGGSYIAILTSHTIHIALLPDPSHLSSTDESPIRLKTQQLGPTIHVLPESPVMSALWHPLGVDNNTLVTITADASVRVWEFKRDDRWSFEKPTLAIDLKKLIDGKSSNEIFEPAPFGTNKGFSPDEVDMEVASASFGGLGLDEEDGWASMTLWIAMRNRDLYALCPLLPSKWQPSATIIPSLSTAVVSKQVYLEEGQSESETEAKICEQQYRWFAEIDQQDPMISPSSAEMYNRPTSIGPIPKLQGPYAFDLPDAEDDDESEITDILVIAAKVDADELFQDDEEVDSELEALMARGISTTLVCLVTETGKVFICMDLVGVEGVWLPKLRHTTFGVPHNITSDLTLVSLETLRHPTQPSDWPIFTQDIHDRYEFFITSMKAVESFSLTSWAERLEQEINSPGSSGLAFRVKTLCSSDSTVVVREDLVENPLKDNPEDDIRAKEGRHFNACLVFHDINLGGYFVLTSNMLRPCAVNLDTPTAELNALPSIEERQRSLTPARSPSPTPLQLLPRPRSPYQPSQSFYSDTPLANFIDSSVPSRHRSALKKEIRLTPVTLDIMTAAHKVLSQESSKLETAAADLFRRCERLRVEMRDQVKQLRNIADKVDRIVDESSDGEDDEEADDFGRTESRIDRRLEDAKRRQKELMERFELVRKRAARSGGKELSDKERAWKSEISRLDIGVSKEKVGGEEEEVQEPKLGRQKGRRKRSEDELLWKRFEMVQDLSSDLLSQVKSASDNAKATPTKATAMSPSRGSTSQVSRIPSKIQKARVSEAMGMVERESAIIDALTARLDRLNTGTSTAV